MFNMQIMNFKPSEEFRMVNVNQNPLLLYQPFIFGNLTWILQFTLTSNEEQNVIATVKPVTHHLSSKRKEMRRAWNHLCGWYMIMLHLFGLIVLINIWLITDLPKLK